MEYYSSFVSGFQDVIGEMLTEKIQDAEILKMMDGAVWYTTKNSAAKNLPCFNNSFEILRSWKSEKDKSINRMMQDLTRIKLAGQIAPDTRKTFRIVTSVENSLVSVDKNLKANIENLILRSTGLKPDRGGAGEEFWLLKRSEDVSFFMRRLTMRRSHDKTLKKGELTPEVAYILNWLAKPVKSDVLLDPFCGYGSIPKSAARHFRYAQIICSDTDIHKIESLQKSSEFKDHSVSFSAYDALRIKEIIEENSIDKIVTDPPWGLFEEIKQDIGVFYGRMLEQFYSVLKPHGRVVLLTARKEEFQSALNKTENIFSFENTYHVLISGKKAAVYVLKTKKINQI